MRAAVTREGRMYVADVSEPVPGPGQVLVETLACGICGSDLHVMTHMDRLVEAARSSGAPVEMDMDPGRELVMGHEFCARVIELGPDATGVRPGDVVVSMPLVIAPGGPFQVGYSHSYPGGYGERMVLTAALCAKVPDGVDFRRAALTEPIAVGVHAVARSRIQKGEGALVLGCGPIGLAVIAALKLEGIEPVVAADFSPARRALAARMGAHVVVDPQQERAIDAWGRVGGIRAPVIFEAVGVPGMLGDVMQFAPQASRIVVVGVCMEPDTIWPVFGVVKELALQFVFGYEPLEFLRTLQVIAQGQIDVAPLITGEIGIADVPSAFETLRNPREHVKVLVEPALG